jgi:hypothetical protein
MDSYNEDFEICDENVGEGSHSYVSIPEFNNRGSVLNGHNYT